MLRTLAIGLASALFVLPAVAHDQLADGRAVPAWVKRQCCGPEDFHPLRPDQVRAKPDGWHLDGYRGVVPYGKEQPSPDGTYVAFWIDRPDGTQSDVFCLFVPPQGF